MRCVHVLIVAVRQLLCVCVLPLFLCLSHLTCIVGSPAVQVYDFPEWSSEYFALLTRLIKMKQPTLVALDATSVVRQLCELIGAHPVCSCVWGLLCHRLCLAAFAS